MPLYFSAFFWMLFPWVSTSFFKFKFSFLVCSRSRVVSSIRLFKVLFSTSLMSPSAVWRSLSEFNLSSESSRVLLRRFSAFLAFSSFMSKDFFFLFSTMLSLDTATSRFFSSQTTSSSSRSFSTKLLLISCRLSISASFAASCPLKCCSTFAIRFLASSVSWKIKMEFSPNLSSCSRRSSCNSWIIFLRVSSLSLQSFSWAESFDFSASNRFILSP